MQKLVVVLFIFTALLGLAFALNESDYSPDPTPACMEQSAEKVSAPLICGCPAAALVHQGGVSYYLPRTRNDCAEVMEHGGEYCMGTCAYEAKSSDGAIIKHTLDCGYGSYA
ncbi:MAG: hypothetical protein IPJ89_05335 [Candidatus Iainarchaeum archaeon]|uniref:Uncharacterized protein n=1 Tax=Candidatus Iainarchaeum sp. TaxID=3101447 RepID=A0A7T9I121_9ARCH|nr:MAG: hypothetical protein IPJ89_05335 [Candidatus Diapherotrites archaeon]